MRVACRRVVCLLIGHMALLALATEVARGQGNSPAAPRRTVSILERSVVDIIDAGANMFNGGDVVGCQRLYEGAILGLRPTLDGMPETRTKVDVFVRESIAAKTSPEKSFALRKALDEVLTASRARPASAAPVSTAPAVAATVPPPTTAAMPAKPAAPGSGVPGETVPPRMSLWVRLGGLDALKPVVSEWVTACLGDPKIDFTRGGKYPVDNVSRSNLELLLVQYISKLTNGTEKYTGRPMLDSHRGMKITDTQFNLMLTHLVEVLRAKEIPREESADLVNIMNASRKEIVEVKETESAPLPDGPAPGPLAAPTGKSLWDRLGGEAAVTTLVHELVARSSKNPSVDLSRGGKYKFDAAGLARFERGLLTFISAHSGGPIKYTGKDMKAAHKGMGITETQFDTMGGDLISVMRNRDYSQELIDELVTLLGSTANEIVEVK